MFSLIFVCFLCSGCGGNGTDGQSTLKNLSEYGVEILNEGSTEQESEADMPGNNLLPPIPKTKAEEEELFGKTTPSGQWIPPKGSYKSSDGYIYNKEGLVIGQWRKPTEKEIANAVG